MAVPPQWQSGSRHLLTSHLEAGLSGGGVGCSAFGRDGSFGATVVRYLTINLLFVGRDFLFDKRRITDIVVCFGFGVSEVVRIVRTVVGFGVVVVVVGTVVVAIEVVVVVVVVVEGGAVVAVEEKNGGNRDVFFQVTGFEEEVKVDDRGRGEAIRVSFW